MRKKTLIVVLSVVLACAVVAGSVAFSGFAAVAAERVVVQIPPTWEFRFVSHFAAGMARVINNDGTFFVTTDGDFLPYSDEFMETWDIADRATRYAKRNLPTPDLFCVEKDNKYGYKDAADELVLPYTYSQGRDFSEGLACVKNDDGKVGYIDETGKVVVPFMYDDILDSHGSFQDGLALVMLDGKYGYIDKNGNAVIPLTYDFANDFSDGLALVRGKEKYGYIDTNDDAIIPFEYDFASDFSEGLAWVEKDEKLGCIDETGNVIIPFDYEPYYVLSALPYIHKFENGVSWACKDGKYGLISCSNQEVTPFIYDLVYEFYNGIAIVYKNNGSGGDFDNWKLGYVDEEGNEIVPCIYDGLDMPWWRENQSFNEGYAWVKLDGKYGILRDTSYESVPALVTPSLLASPTSSTVLVNGQSVAFDAYNINGNNYFKLRDLAYILNGTEKQFEVGWDEVANAISLTSGQSYTTVGGEMEGKGDGAKTPIPTNSKILFNGQEVLFNAYNIGGNNYFKLRDVGETFNFSVEWDGSQNTIVIDTDRGYTS